MKKLAVCALAAVAVAAQAQVTTTGPFATFWFWQEDFDTTAQGPYNALPVFGTPALMQRLGPGSLVVSPWTTANTAPHIIYGNNAHARITTVIPMKRFSGWFHSGIIGLFSPVMTVRFYD